jgi:hypothetical protein
MTAKKTARLISRERVGVPATTTPMQWHNDWQSAITAADTQDLQGPRKSDLRALAGLFRLGPPPRSVCDLLAELCERHRFKATTQDIPPRLREDREAQRQVLLELADEYRSRINWGPGPFKKSEMDKAVKILQGRDKAAGRKIVVKYDGKCAARKLREENLKAFCDGWKLNRKEFRSVLAGKQGSINRAKKRKSVSA